MITIEARISEPCKMSDLSVIFNRLESLGKELGFNVILEPHREQGKD